MEGGRGVSDWMAIRMRTLRAYVAKKSTSSRFLLLLSFIRSVKSFLDMLLGANTVMPGFMAHFGCRIRVMFLACLEGERDPTCGRRRTNDPSSGTTKHVHFPGDKSGQQASGKQGHTPLPCNRDLITP
jgi:hypothetical protein